MKQTAALILIAAVLAGGGCAHEKHRPRRPAMDEISDGGGLQGKDVISSSDQIAQDLLSSVPVNASKTQLLIVVDHVENKTQSQRFDMDIFLARLKTNMSKYGRGRVQLVENRDKLRQLQSSELEQAAPDRFGQGGGGGSAPGPAGIQPDYSLYATVSELPDRETSYFYIQFQLTDLRTRLQPWVSAYEVSTYR